jgi:hypothetical protein
MPPCLCGVWCYTCHGGFSCCSLFIDPVLEPDEVSAGVRRKGFYRLRSQCLKGLFRMLGCSGAELMKTEDLEL